jgi:hypothetical protein
MESLFWTIIDLLLDMPRLLVRHFRRWVRQLLSATH